MPITYTITLDSADDGIYSEDITTDVLDLQWQLGMSAPYDTVAPTSEATVRVVNDTGRYDTVTVGTALRIQSQQGGGSLITHLVGLVAHVEPSTGSLRRPEALITVRGQEVALEEHQLRLPPLTNIRTDEALTHILQQTPIRRLAYAVYCLIDNTGNNLINSTTIFPPEPMPQQFDTGKSTFAYLGDTWANGIRADRAVTQLLDSEQGRFFVNRQGKAVFYNRHHTIMANDTPTVFDNDVDALEYTYGDDRVNDITVQITPRSIGAANTQLWSLSSAIRLDAGETQTITAQFAVGERTVGALEFITPQRDVHFDAHAKADGTGSSRSGDVEVLVQELSFSAAVLQIRNTSRQTRYLTALELRGTPLITGDAIFITERDDLNIYLHGKQSRNLRLTALTSLDEARAIAELDLLRRLAPRGVVRELHLSTQSHPTEARELTLFDKITVLDAQTGHEGSYTIIGEQHQVDKGGTRHQVRWLLEPDDDALFFVINRHDVDDAIRVMLPR